MAVISKTINSRIFIEETAGEIILGNEEDALDLLAYCSEFHTHRILLHAHNLTADFYNLKTRVAGEILQKFANYRVKVAALLPPEVLQQDRFREMVLETNHSSSLFRVFHTRAEAEKWLGRD